MEAIQTWVSSIAAVTMIISVAAVITPKNSAGSVVALLGCMLLTAVLITPIKNIDPELFAEEGSFYENETKESVSVAASESEKLREKLIEERLCEYIYQRTGTTEEVCLIDMTFKDEKPYGAFLRSEDEDALAVVSEILQTEIGIPKERQTFANEV